MSCYSEVCVGGLVALAGVGLLSISAEVQDFSTGTVDAAFMPSIAAALFILFGGIVLVRGLRLPQSAEGALSPQRRSRPGLRSGWGPVSCSFILMIAYAGLLDSLGFILASVAYVFLQIQLLRKEAPPRQWLFALVAISVPTAAYLLFVHAFDVMVPAGVLG